MRLLLDACVWGRATSELQSLGHNVVWAGDWPDDPGDEAILRQAQVESRVVVTLDKDFGELACRRGIPHCGIVRLVDVGARQQAQVIHAVSSRHADDLSRQAILTVDAGRVRVRLAAPATTSETERDEQ